MVNADSTFFTAFNASLTDMTAVFGETFYHERTASTYQSIAIDHETSHKVVMSGGNYINSDMTMYVSEDVCVLSTLREGDIIVIRGDRFSVHETMRDGDASRSFSLISPQIDVWK